MVVRTVEPYLGALLGLGVTFAVVGAAAQIARQAQQPYIRPIQQPVGRPARRVVIPW